MTASEPARLAGVMRLYDAVGEAVAEITMGGRVASSCIRSVSIGTTHTFAVEINGVEVAFGSGACADVAAHRAWADLTGHRDQLPLQSVPRALAAEAAKLAANDGVDTNPLPPTARGAR